MVKYAVIEGGLYKGLHYMEMREDILELHSTDTQYMVVLSKIPKKDEEVPHDGSAERWRRDSLLAETDWVVTRSMENLEDVPDEWKEYRQALRDVTNQEGFPKTIEWPAKP